MNVEKMFAVSMTDKEIEDMRVFFLELTDQWRDYIPDEKVKRLVEEKSMRLIREVKDLKKKLKKR